MSNSIQPYQDEGLNKIYNLLFCDDIGLYRSSTQSASYPWDILLSEKPVTQKLKAIAADKTLEARQRLLACRLLSANGFTETSKELLGVIIEVALEEGPDVLAAFSDGSARYINHSEKLLVWENPTDESDALIEQLFAESETVVQQIGKWEKERRPFPAAGMIRLNFLVADGLYFGEGPFEVLQNDQLGAPVISSAVQLMSYLMQQTP